MGPDPRRSLAKHVANLCRTEVDFADGSLAKVSSGDGRLEIGEVGRRREVRRLGKIRRFGEIAPRPNYFGNGRECFAQRRRSEEHASELQSLMRISYAVFSLKKKTDKSYNESTRIEIK